MEKSHMAFRQIKAPALGNNSVISTKLDVTSITGQTSADTLAGLDTILMHSNALGSLRKVTASDLIGSFTTNDLTEHADAQYFTPARAQAAVAADIASAVAAEAAIARAAELANANAISAEETRATAAEGVNASAITAEETRALSAESALDAAYKAADAALQTSIDNIISNTDAAALDSLSEIVTAYQDADDVFTAGIAANATSIANETTRASTAEGVNATAITTETTRAQGVEATLTSDLATETAARIAGDNALDGRVTANEGDISTLQSGLAAEIAATGGEITVLTNNLAAEVTRATGSESANATAITDEGTARANADTAIRTDFAAADTALQTAMETYADTAEADAIATASADATAKADAAEAAAILAAEAKDVARAATSDAADVALAGRATTLETEMDDAESRLTALEAGNGTDPLDTIAQTFAGGINELHTDTNAVEVRVTDAESDIADNATAIANIISNTDAAALDSLTEIVTAFQTADNAHTATLNANATDRAAIRTEFANADAAITSALNAEIGTTNGEISALQTADTTETAARIAGDAATLASAQAYADTAEADAIATASADATAKADSAEADAIASAEAKDVVRAAAAVLDATTKADQALVDAKAYTDVEVTAEETARIAGDDALQLQITANDGDIATNVTDIATNASAISQEVSDRVAAVAGVQSALDAEISATNADITTLTQDLTAEISRAGTAEAANATSISNEVTRSVAADGVHTAGIAANVIDIAANTADITAETTRATAAELALSGRVTATETDIAFIQSNTDSAALDSLTEIVGAFQSADNTINGAITSLASTASTDRAAIRTEFGAADTALDTRLTTEEGNVDALEATMGTATLTTTAQNVTAAINELNQGSAQAVADLQAEVDLSQTALGLNADGTFAAHSGTNFIDTATTSKGARELLDTALKAEETARIAGDNTVATNAAADATSKANAAQAAAIAAAEAKDVVRAATMTAYVDAEAVVARAAELANANAISAEETRATAAEDANSAAITAEAVIARAAEGANASASAANLVEITATQSGAGLAADGSFVAHTGTNYINAAANLKGTDVLLDSAIKAEADRATLAEGVNAAAITNEASLARAAELTLTNNLATEVTRATLAEGVNASGVSTNATNIASETSARVSADNTLQGNIDTLSATVTNIISNTDAAALDSLTEIVTAFQDADTDLTTLVTGNAADILAEETRALAAEGVLSSALAAEIADNNTDHTAATTDRAAIRSEFAVADTALQNDIDTKLALAGGTMTGNIAMSGGMVSGLGLASAGGDAVSKAYLDSAISAQDISVYTTDDLAEGSNEYYTPAKARAAISVVDTAGAGLVSYNASTGVISVDTNESVLDLTDVSDTSYTGKHEFVLAVNAAEDGMELVDPLSIFVTNGRQTIDGDGSATTYSLTIPATQAQAMVFVGGVIQDPATHYTINDSASTITFVSSIPVGTQAVVLAPQAGLDPVLLDGQVTKEKLSADIKAYTQKASVSAGSGGAVVDSFDGTDYRSAKYIIQVGDGAGNFETREALVVHDGTTAYITEFALVYTGTDLIGDASVAMNGNNVELTYSTTSGTATVKVISTYIDV